jgi:hypothetical protein
MRQDEIDATWSRRVASLATDALVDAGFVATSNVDNVCRIIADEVLIRLSLRDRPANETTLESK